VAGPAIGKALPDQAVDGLTADRPLAAPTQASGVDASARAGWTGRALRAFRFGIQSSDNVLVALAGFLVRGGLVFLAVPSVVLPSVIGLAGTVGISSFSIDGSPTARFYELVALAIAGVTLWLATAAVVGSLVDVWLVEAARSPAERLGDQARPLPDGGTLLDMIAVRGLCLLPLAATLLWAASRIYSATYDELLAPSNLAVPLFVRIAERQADGIAAVVIVWLATETLAALAVRHLLLAGGGVGSAMTGAVSQVVRRPLSTLMTTVLWSVAGFAAMAGTMAAAATAYGLCLETARLSDPIAVTVGLGALSTTRDFRPVVFVLVTLVLVAAWLAGAAVSGVASAWRSAAWTEEVVAALGSDQSG